MRFWLSLALLSMIAPVQAAGRIDHGPPGRGFNPLRFFAGRTEGEGTLQILFHPARPFRVHGTGHLTKGGALVLRQVVEIKGEPPAQREWRLERQSPSTFAGTLTDAAGPVSGRLIGGVLFLRYPMKGGLLVEQRLAPLPDGDALDNRLTVRALFLPVARVRETIRR